MFYKKEQLRKISIKKRLNMLNSGLIDGISSLIVKKIINSADFIKAKNIALYYPIKGEVSLLELLKIENKNYYFPKCSDNDLEFIKYCNDFKKDKYDIPTPTGNPINPKILDIIYTPSLAANSKNYRLGYGKGFYDRFFSKRNLKAKKIIVLSHEFKDIEFREDEFDVKYDEIISDK